MCVKLHTLIIVGGWSFITTSQTFVDEVGSEVYKNTVFICNCALVFYLVFHRFRCSLRFN